MVPAVMLLLLAAGLAVALSLRRFFLVVYEIQRVRQLTAKIPGPTPNPVLGNALEFNCPIEDIYDRVVVMTNKYAPMLRVVLGHLTFVAVMDPVDMEALLKSEQTEKSRVYSAMEPLMGKGLATLNGGVWRHHRKAITPSLHLDILKDFVHIFHKRALCFADQLAGFADDGQVFDVTPLSGACANSTICETVMSSDVDDDDPGKKAFLDAIPKGLDHFMYRVWHPWFLSEWAYSLNRRLFPEYLEVKNALKSFTERIIREKRAAMTTPHSPQDNNNSKHKKRQAFLDHVLSSEEGATLSESELAEEVKTIVTIASGSSMDAITFIIYTLAILGDVQDRVKQEMNDVLGDDPTRPVTCDDLAHMHYTECVIKEVLRYFSVVPVFARTMSADFELPSGVMLPRGCQVAFWLPHTHHNPKYFPQPDKFDPDRFLPENSRGRHPFSFVPFSAGPRNCIGQRYAMMFMKTVTATLVPRLCFEVPDDGPKSLRDVRLIMNLTLSVRGGANIRVHRR